MDDLACQIAAGEKFPSLALGFKLLDPTILKHHLPVPKCVKLTVRQKALKEEIAKALSNCSPDDLMVADLKSRMLHLNSNAFVMQLFGIDVEVLAETRPLIGGIGYRIAVRGHYRHSNLGRIAPSIPPGMIFGKDISIR